MNTSSRVHWLGAGLSSGPGIRRLAAGTCRLPCGTARWRRRAGRSRASTPPPRCARTTWRASRARWKPGDIVVSMLPAPMHPDIARVCLDGGAHRHHQLHLGRHARLRQRGQAEGPAPRQRERLDPGLDTCSRTSWSPSTGRRPATMPKPALLPLLLRRLSPAAERLPLQFSRSPLGVLRALRSPARALKEGAVRECRASGRRSSFQVTGGRRAEAFRPYPNRDSMPYVGEYGFDAAWPLQTFRARHAAPGGWSAAWKDIFAKVGTLTDRGASSAGRPAVARAPVREGDPDRGALRRPARDPRGWLSTAFDRAYVMDEAAPPSARRWVRSRLPARHLRGRRPARGQDPPGVHGAPSDPATIARWFHSLAKDGARVNTIEAGERAA